MWRTVVPLIAAAWLTLALPISGGAKSPHSPLPLPIIEECRCSAAIFVRSAGGQPTKIIQTTFVPGVDGAGAPRDTCPASSRLDVEWHAEPRGARTGFRYKLADAIFDSSSFIEVGRGVKRVTYDPIPGLPGIKVFTLGVKGSAGIYTDSTRRFQVNYPPDTWWAGPDRNSPSLLTKPNGEKYALLVGGQVPGGISGSLLSADSTQVLPAVRAERRTFFEIWEDTVFARQEGDTVHMNSWVLIHGGGFDRDSRYAVRVSDAGRQLPDFPGGSVLEPGPANGSPIGFHSRISMSLTPDGAPSRTALSGLYPVFDPDDVFHFPRIGGYHPAFYAGRAFAVIQAEDGDGDRDRRVQDEVALVMRVENGTATPYEQALRSKVLTFFVDRAPYFVTSSPLFRPMPADTFRAAQWDLRLVGNDDDPYYHFGTPVGGPSSFLILRRKIKVHGKDLQGNDFTYVDPNTYVNQQNITVNVPATLAVGPCVIEVELCDCDACEIFPGSGRCIVSRFPVIYQPVGGDPAAIAAAGSPTGVTPAPPVAIRTLLLAPYPNPASRSATIRFRLATAGGADVELYNLAGQRVRRLASERLPAGEHLRIWNGRDDAGRPVSAGVYFVRLRTQEATLARKVFVAP